jgi:hypothetical protein
VAVVRVVYMMNILVLQSSRPVKTNICTQHNYCVFGHYPSSCFLFKTRRFGHLILSVSSVKNLLSWPQSIELIPLSEHQHQQKKGYINQAQHKPLARVKTNIKNIRFTLKNSNAFHCQRYNHLKWRNGNYIRQFRKEIMPGSRRRIVEVYKFLNA